MTSRGALDGSRVGKRQGYRSGQDAPPDTEASSACETMAAAAQQPTRTQPDMFERLFGTKEQDPAMAERIPPAQYKTDKFPRLPHGSAPNTDLATWDFKVWGEVAAPFTLPWAQFKDLPRNTVH